jgi:hypothetical protein
VGQYYVICNLDKKQYLHPHRFTDGLKLLEFGASAGATMTGLAILLATSNGRGGGDLRSERPIVGSWAGDRIAISGDYAEHGDPGEPEKGSDQPTHWDAAFTEGSGWVDISDQVIEALLDDQWLKRDFVERVKHHLRYDPNGEGKSGSHHSPLLWPGLYQEAKDAVEREAQGRGKEDAPVTSLRPDILIQN